MLFLPLSRLIEQTATATVAGCASPQPDVDGAICLFCIQQYAVFAPVSVLHKLLRRQSPAAQARYVISCSRTRSETTALQKEKKEKGKAFLPFLFRCDFALSMCKASPHRQPIIARANIMLSCKSPQLVELKAAKTHTVLYQINRTEYYCQVDLPLSDYPLYGKQLVSNRS